MPPASDDCDECKPGGSMQAPTAIIFASFPFIFTFLIVSTVVLQRLFPLLSGEAGALKTANHVRPFSASSFTRNRPTIKQVSAITFSSTVALTTVLAELILCEISNSIPVARDVALRITISLLLFLLIIAIPFLEIHSIIAGAGYDFTGPGKGRLRLAWLLQTIVFGAWLLGFWWSGEYLLGQNSNAGPENQSSTTQTISDASLSRIGVIGISVMSLLSGFASVSAPWQNFFARAKPVTEATIARKQAGLEATQDMLATKRSRLRALERKMSETTSESFFQKAIGSIRGNVDSNERQSLLLEISGLEAMALSLSSSHAALQSRYKQQEQARTAKGRLLLSSAYAFSVFCMYRIVTTLLTFIRRSLATRSHPSDPPFTTSDPVDNILALLAKHYDPHLDQAVWARTISFLLSGIILFASFSSVMQTFHFFARFLPSLLKTIQANLALVVAQVCATYVISAALMLRAMVPGDVVGDGLKGLGGGVGRMKWVDGWFERWFLAGVIITMLGIWIGRQVGSGYHGLDDDDDDTVAAGSGFDENGALEMGKRS